MQHDQVQAHTRDNGHTVLERIEQSASLPASVSAALAFETVMGALVQRLPAVGAAELVERRLPAGLAKLLERDAEEALEDGVQSDLESKTVNVLEADEDRRDDD